MGTGVKENILAFFNRGSGKTNHRYQSWEHCYLHFREPADKDLDALHLGFFLASWGMYRGSSQLLKKDYKVHIPIVCELRRDQYASLWDAGVSKDDMDLLFKLVKKLKQIYCDACVSPTSTLITKVLLGTICCTPAHDTYFKKGIKAWNACHPGETKLIQRFGRNSYNRLLDFYHERNDALSEAQEEIRAKNGITYPIMKLIDMYFWELGRSSK